MKYNAILLFNAYIIIFDFEFRLTVFLFNQILIITNDEI